MDTELSAYVFFMDLIGKYLIPVLATNLLTDITGRFVNEKHKVKLMPVICIAYAVLCSIVYGYIEEESVRATVEHGFTILAISGILFTSGAYNSLKSKIKNLIHKNGSGGNNGKTE